MNFLTKIIFLFSTLVAVASLARTPAELREKCVLDLDRLGHSGKFDEESPARSVEVTVVDYGPGNKFDWVRDLRRSYDLNSKFAAKYPKFFKSLRIELLSTSEILVPSDAATINGAADAYNEDKPVAQQIPLRWFDEFTRKGISTLEFLIGWTKGLVPINQSDAYHHNHDVGFHFAYYMMLPHEVILRSQHNFSLLLELLKTPAFRRNDEFKDNLLLHLNLNLETEPAKAFGLLGAKNPSGQNTGML